MKRGDPRVGTQNEQIHHTETLIRQDGGKVRKSVILDFQFPLGISIPQKKGDFSVSPHQQRKGRGWTVSVIGRVFVRKLVLPLHTSLPVDRGCLRLLQSTRHFCRGKGDFR